MSDEDRRRLGQAAGNGDLAAAERLVLILRRELNAVLTASTRIDAVPDAAFRRDRLGRPTLRVKFMNIMRQVRMPGRPHRSPETLLDLAEFTRVDLGGYSGFGPVYMALVEDLLEQARLRLRES